MSEDQKGSLIKFSPKGRYKPSFSKELVHQIEEGLDLHEACMLHGIYRGTLLRWMKKYGSASYVYPSRAALSIQEKRSICRSVADGRLSIKEAAAACNTKTETVIRWLSKEKDELSGSNNLPLSKPKKVPLTERPAGDVKTLQEQLAYANLKIAALNTLIDVAEEQLKINIRKKPGAKQS